MQEQINQAVVFTKPVHHLGIRLSPEQLATQAQTFFEGHGLTVVLNKPVAGKQLSKQQVIQQHYLMYSKAACVKSPDELGLSAEAQTKFELAFGKSWADEKDKVFGSPALQQVKGISSHELYLLWNEQFSSRKTEKIQDGVIMAWLPDMGAYCINAFYPAMEENFNNPATKMTYYVVEFDPKLVSWAQFRKKILGVTDASKADPASLRGELYMTYGADLEFPGRDNFVHGSAGPLEGLIERTIHEPEFDMATNPVGRYLLKRGIDLESFKRWKAGRSIPQLGDLFDATEERDTDEVLDRLNEIQFNPLKKEG